MSERFRHNCSYWSGFVSICITALICLTCNNQSPGIQASGTIEATEIRVSSKVSGEVTEVPVQEGSVVKKGDTLARIDTTTLALKREQALAGVALAEANFSRLLKGARAEDIKQAEEQLVQAQENYRQAKEDNERMQTLFTTNSVTKKQLDDSSTRFSVTKAQVGATAAALKKLQNLAQPEDIKMMQAQLDQAKIQLALLDKQLADCNIIAPCAGTVTHKLVEAGEFVGLGTPVCILADLTTVFVTIYVNEKNLGQLKIGQEARIYIDTFTDPFPGRIDYISSVAEFTPKNIQTREERIKQVFAVKLEVANPDGALKAGLPADAIIPLPDLSHIIQKGS